MGNKTATNNIEVQQVSPEQDATNKTQQTNLKHPPSKNNKDNFSIETAARTTYEGRDHDAAFNNSTGEQPRTTTDDFNLNLNNDKYVDTIDFVKTSVDIDKFNNTTIEPINYETFKKIKLGPKLDVSVFQEALNPVTNSIKHAATVLFQADCKTYDAMKVLELFQLDDYYPKSLRYASKVTRKDYQTKYFPENDPDLRDRNIRLAKINKQHMLEAKETVLEEKIAMVNILQDTVPLILSKICFKERRGSFTPQNLKNNFRRMIQRIT